MIKILITGDFCPHKRIEKLVIAQELDKVYNDFIPVLEGNDINITNLECPLTNKKSPIRKIGPGLSADEECINALTFGGFNVVTLSNNHIMDQGEEEIHSTMRLCKEKDISYVGAGSNLMEASKVLYKYIQDKCIAILNFSENEFSTAKDAKAGSNPLSIIKNYYSIKTASKKADYTIIIIHGGHEGYTLPSPRMAETYRFFIDAGADIVIGHHPHCYSGYEKYNNGYIFYSLGNFIFDWEGYRNTDWNFGYAVKFYFSGNKISFDIIPYRQCDVKPGVFLLNESENNVFYARLEELNNTIKSNELLREEWKKLVEKRKKFYLVNFELFNSKIYKSLRYKNLLPGLLSRKKKQLLLNMIRCEAHRDLAIESLE